MPTTTGRYSLGVEEIRRLAHFENLFGTFEQMIKRRLRRGQNDRTPISRLIDQYEVENPLWADDAQSLRRMCTVRNIIVHERTVQDGYPLSIPTATLHRLRQLIVRLERQKPVDSKFRRSVTTVAPEDSLASVLALAYAKEYSQFPVIASGRFCGIITENGITRWLGHYVQYRGPTPDLVDIHVAEVIKEEGKEKGRGSMTYCFVRSDKPVDEVMALFGARPMLEAVLITSTGKSGAEPLVGIVTSWDASRHSLPLGHRKNAKTARD